MVESNSVYIIRKDKERCRIGKQGYNWESTNGEEKIAKDFLCTQMHKKKKCTRSKIYWKLTKKHSAKLLKQTKELLLFLQKNFWFPFSKNLERNLVLAFTWPISLPSLNTFIANKYKSELLNFKTNLFSKSWGKAVSANKQKKALGLVYKK